MVVPCPYCQLEMRQAELSAHMMTCRRAPPRPKLSSKSRPAACTADNVRREVHALDGIKGGCERRGADVRWTAQPPSDMHVTCIEGGRMPCSVCGRRFALDRIAVHTAICQRVAAKARKRGVFDASKQRLTDEVLPFAPRFGKQGRALGRGTRGVVARAGSSASRKGVVRGDSEGGGAGRTYTNWRQKRDELLQGLRAAREYKAQTQGRAPFCRRTAGRGSGSVNGSSSIMRIGAYDSTQGFMGVAGGSNGHARSQPLTDVAVHQSKPRQTIYRSESRKAGVDVQRSVRRLGAAQRDVRSHVVQPTGGNQFGIGKFATYKSTPGATKWDAGDDCYDVEQHHAGDLLHRRAQRQGHSKVSVSAAAADRRILNSNVTSADNPFARF